MQNSRLIRLLKIFSAEEFKSFGKFIRSPLYNRHKDLIRYYTCLKEYYPAFSGNNFTQEKIFAHVYNGRKFSKNEFLKLSSSMSRMCDLFLKLQLDRFTTDFNLLNHYVNRNLDKEFLSLYKKVSFYIDNEEGLDNMIFVKKIYLETLFIRFNMNRDRQRNICGDIIKRGNYFAYQSLLWIMIQNRDMITNFNAFNYEYRESTAFKFIESVKIEKLVSEISFEDNRLGRYLKYYTFCILITQHPEKPEYFKGFKDSFSAIYNELNRLEKNNFLARMQTYVMNKVQGGKLDLAGELLDSYRFFFSNKDDIFENGFIPMPPLRNSVITAFISKDEDFLKELVEKYSLQVHTDYIQDTHNICKAWYDFYLKNFEGVIDSLKIFEYNYEPHKLDVKNIQLKTYFEMCDYERLESHVDSFRHFALKNKNLTPTIRRRQLELINWVNKIAGFKSFCKKFSVSDIINELNAADLNIFNKLWLKEKIEELI